MLCSMTTSAVPAVFSFAHKRDETRDAPKVHAARHLVEEQEPRPGRERPGQLEALALARGEDARVRLRLVGEPDRSRPRAPRAGRARDRPSLEGAHHHFSSTVMWVKA